MELCARSSSISTRWLVQLGLENYKFLTPSVEIKQAIFMGFPWWQFWTGFLTSLPYRLGCYLPSKGRHPDDRLDAVHKLASRKLAGLVMGSLRCKSACRK
jgi:hypothetical protein